jgi:hypothetical protein
VTVREVCIRQPGVVSSQPWSGCSSIADHLFILARPFAKQHIHQPPYSALACEAEQKTGSLHVAVDCVADSQSTALGTEHHARCASKAPG